MGHPRMEEVKQIKQTLGEIDKRIPDAVRAAVGLEHHYQNTSLRHNATTKTFAASLLRPKEQDHKAAPAFDETSSKAISSPRKSKPEQDNGDGGEDQGALRMEWASCYVPDHGEDAHFGHDGVIGVADGVGGHRAPGVDAGAFARGLMASASAQVAAAAMDQPTIPYTLLERAYDETVASEATGGSTAVILSLASDVLKWAYIGDSGFAVLRDGKIVHRSVPQTRYFNAPFYLSCRGGKSITAAKVGETPVRHGDVVVAGTDGLFDNVSDAGLEKVVRIGTASGFSAKNMADIIGGTAYEMSRCPVKDSPFAVESQKDKVRVHYRGGKVDDITVVVALFK
uniref:Protein phosphatase n=1 Tax=Leersia perrieri TaxID=77586 RepID=A0A0D9VIN4_9ORYZ